MSSGVGPGGGSGAPRAGPAGGGLDWAQAAFGRVASGAVADDSYSVVVARDPSDRRVALGALHGGPGAAIEALGPFGTGAARVGGADESALDRDPFWMDWKHWSACVTSTA